MQPPSFVQFNMQLDNKVIAQKTENRERNDQDLFLTGTHLNFFKP